MFVTYVSGIQWNFCATVEKKKKNKTTQKIQLTKLFITLDYSIETSRKLAQRYKYSVQYSEDGVIDRRVA